MFSCGASDPGEGLAFFGAKVAGVFRDEDDGAVDAEGDDVADDVVGVGAGDRDGGEGGVGGADVFDDDVEGAIVGGDDGGDNGGGGDDGGGAVDGEERGPAPSRRVVVGGHAEIGDPLSVGAHGGDVCDLAEEGGALAQGDGVGGKGHAGCGGFVHGLEGGVDVEEGGDGDGVDLDGDVGDGGEDGDMGVVVEPGGQGRDRHRHRRQRRRRRALQRAQPTRVVWEGAGGAVVVDLDADEVDAGADEGRSDVGDALGGDRGLGQGREAKGQDGRGVGRRQGPRQALVEGGEVVVDGDDVHAAVALGDEAGDVSGALGAARALPGVDIEVGAALARRLATDGGNAKAGGSFSGRDVGGAEGADESAAENHRQTHATSRRVSVYKRWRFDVVPQIDGAVFRGNDESGT